jgi:polysaccharide export outer membrane protein
MTNSVSYQADDRGDPDPPFLFRFQVRRTPMMFREMRGKLVMMVILALASAGVQSQAPKPYTLRHGDAVMVSVWRDEALRMEVRVLPDGSITFPLAGRVEVAGLSTSEAEARIAEKLKKFIPDPVVTVAITGIEGSRVYVLGKVVNPGPFVLTSPNTSVLQVLSQTGGLDRFADGNSIRVLRDTPQGPQVLPVRYNDLLKGSQLETNVVLVPGDTILVP